MRALVFLVCLFFLLFGGYNYHYAGAHYHSFRHADAARKKLQQVKFTATERERLVYKEAVTDDNQDCLLTDYEDSDEDGQELLVRKTRLLARWCAYFTFQSILSYQHNCYKSPPVFYGQISYKYIVQGVLRI